jgi:hypothetical protein
MECTLCEDGTVADIEEAIEEGWMPSFWVDEEEYGCVCPTCIDKYLEEGMDRASSSSKMSDKLFDKLKVDIEMAMNHLDELQKLYRKQTGKDFVRPVRL